MDQIIEKVHKRKLELRQQNEANAREMAELDAFVRKYEELKTKGALGQEEPLYSGVGEKILANVEQILLEQQPRPLRDIYLRLRERGIELGGKSFENQLLNLSSLLSRADDRFESRGRKAGWKLLAKRPPKGEGQ